MKNADLIDALSQYGPDTEVGVVRSGLNFTPMLSVGVRTQNPDDPLKVDRFNGETKEGSSVIELTFMSTLEASRSVRKKQ
jgi:hypothetical protein